MSKVTPQEIIELLRDMSLAVLEYATQDENDECEINYRDLRVNCAKLIGRIEAHGIAPPDGMVLAPESPTFEMCQAGGFKWESPWQGGFPAAYRAMLAAAPEVKP